MSWRPPKGLDPEVRALCVAMNRLPGIATVESCSGHGKTSFCIWFHVTDFTKRGLLTLARSTCPRYYSTPFEIKLNHGDLVHSQVAFLLEGPKGSRSFRGAERLAAIIMNHVRDRGPGYNILYDRASPSVRNSIPEGFEYSNEARKNLRKRGKEAAIELRKRGARDPSLKARVAAVVRAGRSER